MIILITGFAPFGGETINPSYEAVRLLPDEIAGHTIKKQELPVTFQEAPVLLAEKVRAIRPDVLISVGQAGGRPDITPERVAINLMDARIPDNDGFSPVDIPVEKDGETAYFTTLPVKKMVEAMKEAGIPAGLSYSAGSYVCNTVMYAGLSLAAHEFPAMRSGFIHVPFIPEQLEGKKEGTPAMELSMIAKGLEAAIKAL